MRSVLMVILAFCLSWPRAAVAVDAPLDAYLAEAVERNPRVKAAFQSYRAALERVPQVGALDDPEVSIGLFVRPMERLMGNQRAQVSVMQMFPWRGTLDAAQSEAAAMAKAEYEAFREARSSVLYEVKATYYALFLLEREIEATRAHIQILNTLARTALGRFAAGDVNTAPSVPSAAPQTGMANAPTPMGAGMGGGGTESPEPPMPDDAMSMVAGGMGGAAGMVDVLRVRMEVNEMSNRLALLEDGRRPLAARLNALVDRPSDAAVEAIDTLRVAAPPVPLSEVPDSIRRANPMLLMLEKEEEAFLAQARMNRKMGFPMVGVGVQYSLFERRPGSNMEMNGRDMVMPMVTVRIPLWRKKYTASVRASRARAEGSALQRRDADRMLQVTYEEAMRDLNDATRRIDLYRRQRDLARQATRILTARYAADAGDFDEVLRMQRQLLDFSLEELDAVVDRNVAVAMLERLMGR